MAWNEIFAVDGDAPSCMVRFAAARFDHLTQAEPGGQLVCCTLGEIDLFGHAGEWVIPADHMVYIPSDRMFRIRARVPTAGVVAKFTRGEVAWRHDGCWVGPVTDPAQMMTEYGCKWTAEAVERSRQAASFFVTLGEMLPDWFCHERINWTPYAENSTVQRAIDFARKQGPSVTLPEVAAHVAMSERTLRRHMLAELGQSWREFIRELKMNRAMELLRRERRSVTETAFEVGFSSSSAFSQAFLDYVGKSPSAYAKAFAPARMQ